MDYQHSIIPWYKQFWPWFLILLPGSVVVAGIVTIWIAMNHDVGLVKENYYKEGLDINAVLQQAEAATLYKVNANILFSEQDQQVTVFLSSEASQPKSLSLKLSAPFIPDNDHSIMLAAQNSNLFIGAIEKPLKGRYYLTIVPNNNEWRLSEEVTFPIQDPITIPNNAGNLP